MNIITIYVQEVYVGPGWVSWLFFGTVLNHKRQRGLYIILHDGKYDCKITMN